MKTNQAHVHVGPVVLVVEIQLDRDRSPDCIAAIFSVAGRDSLLTLHWPLQSGRIDARVLEDLTTTVARQIATSVTGFCGVQGVLPIA